MMNFQHFNNIRRAIKTNTKCMFDILKNRLTSNCESSDQTIEVYPAIVTSHNDDATKSDVVITLVILVTTGDEQLLLDPSYDVFSRDNKRYYLNIKEFVDALADADKKQNELKSLAMDFLFHNEIAKQIGDGSFDDYNRELYQKQTEYVELKTSLSETVSQ